MDKNLHIYTHFNCIVTLNTSQTFIKKNTLFSCSWQNLEKKNYDESLLDNCILLSIFPLNDAQPFFVTVDLKNFKIHTENPFAKLVRYGDIDYLLTILSPPFDTPAPYSLNYKKLSFGGSSHEIIYSSFDSFLLCVKNNNDKLVLTDKNFVGNITFYTSQNHLLFYGKTEKSNYIFGQIDYLDKKYKKIAFNEVSIIDKKQDEFVVIKNLYDFGHHSTKTTYNLKNFSVTHQLVYDTSLQYTTKQNLIPYAFIDAIKVKDFDLARKYLSTKLSNTLDDLHLSSFFGNFVDTFQNIKANATTNQLALFYGTNQLYQAKIYNFEMQENKIINIYEE